MKEEYEKALQKLKELKKRVSPKEWNQISKEENLLSSETIKYIAQKDFHTLQADLKGECHKNI